MALTFLRHHRKKALSKSPASASAAAASAPKQTPSATAKQDPSSTADNESLASETPSVGDIPPRSPDEEQDSGICPDSGSDFSRQGSSDSSWTGKDGPEEEDEEERDGDDCLRGAAGEDCLEDQNFSTASCEDPSAGFVSAMPGDVPDIVPESVLLYRNSAPEPEEPHWGPVDDSDFGSRDSLHEVQSPTVPPAPPPPGLDLRGDHTTSSTTDADGDREAFGRRRKASRRISGAETLPPFTIERSTVDDYELRLPQGRATFYQARIGVAPEDTELGMLFRKRADRNRIQSDEESEKDVTLRVHRTDAKQESLFSESSHRNEASKLEGVENKKSPENVKTEANSDDRTAEYHPQQKTETDAARDREDSFARKATDDDDSLAADGYNDIVQDSGNTADDQSQRETTESGENEEEGFDALVEDFDHRLQEEEEDNPPEVLLLSAQSQHSISSPELSSSSSSSEAGVDPVGQSPSFLLPSEDVFDYDLIASSAQTVQERRKLLSQPLHSYDIILTDIAVETADCAPPEMERINQSNRLSFRRLLKSLISPFGKANKVREAAAAAETGKMAFDDNWSMHDTIRDNSRNDPKRSLRNVFDNYEVRSLAETVDFNRNDGKDHSVRNWKDFVEKSGGGGGESLSSTPVDPSTAAGKSDSGPSPTVLDAVTTADIKPKVAGAEATPVAGRLSGKFRKSKSKTEMMEEIRSNRASSSSGLNSILPSRRNHGMMQSLDSIFPASKLPMTTTTTTGQNQQRHYQKRHETEPRKRAPAAKGSSSSALLSPVVRRRLRSLNGKK